MSFFFGKLSSAAFPLLNIAKTDPFKMRIPGHVLLRCDSHCKDAAVVVQLMFVRKTFWKELNRNFGKVHSLIHQNVQHLHILYAEMIRDAIIGILTYCMYYQILYWSIAALNETIKIYILCQLINFHQIVSKSQCWSSCFNRDTFWNSWSQWYRVWSEKLMHSANRFHTLSLSVML